MKFMMNGALTIGTLDGANVEMREEAGAENFFLFGLTVQEVGDLLAKGYRPRDYVAGNPELTAAIAAIADGHFSGGDTEVFAPLVSNLVDHDPFLVMADYADYIRCQAEVDRTWHNRNTWARMSILNSARSGKFSSDRSIAEYCDEIWNVQPVTIKGQ
jgi:starch phosphorylase